MTKPHLSVTINHQLGTLHLDVSFQTDASWTILFGPSGSGKSTVLRTLAGFIRPDHATISVSGVSLAKVPAHLRPMRWSGQRTALFPKMTVRQNIAAAAPEAADDALAAFHLAHLADKFPAALSGGEQQRVAVARTAASARGRLLLLDEPFAGLDTQIRNQVIHDLRTWLPTSPILSVTHDVGEAFYLQAEVIRLASGRIVAQGPYSEVLNQERLNLLSTFQPK